MFLPHQRLVGPQRCNHVDGLSVTRQPKGKDGSGSRRLEVKGSKCNKWPTHKSLPLSKKKKIDCRDEDASHNITVAGEGYRVGPYWY